jgi:hypothetical protein
MPNWCENKLTIRGNKEDLFNFLKKHYVVAKEFCCDDYLDFNTIIPEPKTPEECESPYVIPKGEDRHLVHEPGYEWFDWYNWHCDKWGTKWNSTGASTCEPEAILSENLTEIVIWFDTAWSPCRPIINKLIEMYPNLKFDYCFFEPGCWFGGRITYSDDDVYYEEDYDNDELKQFSIDEHFMSQEYYDEMEEE